MTLQESRDTRIKLHKEYYTNDVLFSIGNGIINNLSCDGRIQSVSAPSSQITLELDTSEPSKLNLDAAVNNALFAFIQTTPLQMCQNMYNILITHVGGNDKSLVAIML